MKKQEWEYAVINKCAKGFYVRSGDNARSNEIYNISQTYCFNTYLEAAAFIAEQMGEDFAQAMERAVIV